MYGHLVSERWPSSEDRIFLATEGGRIWVRVEFTNDEEPQRVSVPLTWREALHLGEDLMKSASRVAAGG